jgi:hypothetical protein
MRGRARHPCVMDEGEIERLRKAIYRSYGNQPHKKRVWLALLEMYGGAGKKPKRGPKPKTTERVGTGRAAVNSSRCSVSAPRKLRGAVDPRTLSLGGRNFRA